MGQRVDISELLKWLASHGFHGTSAVELPGEFSSRGGILDVFAPDWHHPVRIELFDDEIESTREKVRKLIGAASTDEVIITSGTTMSINLVAAGWGRKFIEPGDEIVLNEMEHHANLVPWQRVAAERAAAAAKRAAARRRGRANIQ